MSENDKTPDQSGAPDDSTASAVNDSPGSPSAVANELQIDRNKMSGSWFRLSPRDTSAVLVLVASILGLAMIQYENVSRLPLLLMIVFFGFMVWKRSALALSFLFAVLGWVKFSQSFRSSHWFLDQLDVLGKSDIIFTILVLAFAAASFRFMETRKYSLGVLSKFGWGGGASSSKKTGREFPSLLGGRWWLIPVAVAAAFLLLEVFPVDRLAVRKYWIRPKPMRLIFLIGVLFLVWFVIRSLFMLIMRWRMDQDQAGVHIRSVFAKEFWREHRAIEVRRAKAISKKV